ncbi:hypothetical protein BKA82DRAFT_992254 [Pisolithus tinctorius]|uniref:Uncharacterized protein n=1 Tax=Pisolithus tinctorius Marx 270 TaxID=870435 RepID=A0A0C3JXX9_PISTI|nr:hypothetical protein BKA82DRAFT_992254 [Pisolithus tinctorius]KIO13993.1 hypothetical protein M404DRAFT_992254 [Pisolithus tinctorius Marx 270]
MTWPSLSVNKDILSHLASTKTERQSQPPTITHRKQTKHLRTCSGPAVRNGRALQRSAC